MAQNFDNSSLMEEVRRYPCLYDRNSKEYKDKYKKMNAWLAIATKFNLTPSSAEAKFKNIRTSYGRWLKKMKTIPSGSGRDAVPPMEFSNLDWLQSHISHRATTTNMPENVPETAVASSPTASHSLDADDELDESGMSEEQSFEEFPENEENRPQETTAPETTTNLSTRTVQPATNANKKAKPWANGSRKKTVDNFDQALLKTAESLAEHVKNGRKRQLNEPEDSDDLFCRSLAPRLKNLPSQSKAMMRVQIEQLFLQAEFPCSRVPLQQMDITNSYSGQSIRNVVVQNDNIHYQF